MTISVCTFVCLCQWLDFMRVTRSRCLIKFNYNICPFLPHFYLINMWISKNSQCSGFGGQRPPKHVQRPLNIFRSTWKCSEATKQLKTQLKTQLQTRMATLIKAISNSNKKFSSQGNVETISNKFSIIYTQKSLMIIWSCQIYIIKEN